MEPNRNAAIHKLLLAMVRRWERDGSKGKISQWMMLARLLK